MLVRGKIVCTQTHRQTEIEILLPESFTNLTMQDYFHESAIVVTEEGFYDIMASPPGEHHASFSYSLDIASDVVEITKKMSMPTAQFMVFSQLPPGNLKGLGDPAGNMTLGDGSSAEYFTVSSLERGQEVKFQLTGFSVERSQRQTVIILSVLFGVMGLLAVKRALLKKA